MARLGKRERALKAARQARIARSIHLVPQSMCRSAWSSSGIPNTKPAKAWGYDANKARSLHKPQKVRHIKG